MRIKKSDTVFVIAGKDHGKTGDVLRVFPKDDKVLVNGVNVAKHHLKPSKKNPHGGITEMPMPIVASNVMIVCPHCGKISKVGYKLTAKKKERICKKCQANLDVKESNAKS